MCYPDCYSQVLFFVLLPHLIVLEYNVEMELRVHQYDHQAKKGAVCGIDVLDDAIYSRNQMQGETR